jgi:DNA uptake protein ComE-like DNA-binding protein
MANWRDYFEFNKRERNGTLALMCILVGMIGVLHFRQYATASDPMDFRNFEDQIDAFQEQQSQRKEEEGDKYSQYNKTTGSETSKAKAEPSYFNFDPNNLPIEKWQELGLSAKQAQSIHKYEAKGGKFRQKEDVLKMYVVDQKLYDKLQPYIQIKQPEKAAPSYTQSNDYEKAKTEPAPRYKPKNVSVALNSADTTQLVALRGIGPSYARRIVKYRNMLGGFVSKAQLMEVYGMDQERYDGFIANVTLNPLAIVHIDVNTCTAEELKNHPYIRWNIANAIVNYRHIHGPYRVLEDIQQSDLVTADLYAKIAPYLIVQ